MTGMEAIFIPIGVIPNQDEGDPAIFLFREGIDTAEGGGQFVGSAGLLAKKIYPDTGGTRLCDFFPMTGQVVQNTHSGQRNSFHKTEPS
jgi:hypothetical protein